MKHQTHNQIIDRHVPVMHVEEVESGWVVPDEDGKDSSTFGFVVSTSDGKEEAILYMTRYAAQKLFNTLESLLG